MVTRLLVFALFVGGGLPRASLAQGDVRGAILSKLEYDRSYFQQILRLQAEGRTHPALDAEGFAREVGRARLYLPTLDRVLQQRAAYENGRPIDLPGSEEALRVYRNLVIVLDMEQAASARDHKAVVDLGVQAVIRSSRDLGLVRTDDDRYYLQLYREFFYLMASASFRLERDGEAVAWLERVEGEAAVKALREKLATAKSAVDDRAERLALLRLKPIAVMPLEAVDPGDGEAQWLGSAIAESLSNDLVQHTELLVVERSQSEKLLGEAFLAKSGITDARSAQRVGELLSAGSLLVGTWRRDGGRVTVGLRLADTADGRVLVSVERTGPGDAVGVAREALLALLGPTGFLSEAAATAVRGARLPEAEGLKALLDARLALSRDPERARALYAEAAKKDPAMARAFRDLRKQFANVTQVVAVTPFANLSGRQDDLWMAQGAVEALSNDLPRLGFTVTERTQLSALLKQVQLGQLLDADLARAAAGKLDADFVVVGSVLRQSPRVRIECRFVEIRTAVVVNAAAADGPETDFPDVLARLSQEIARRFNEKLSEKTLSELMGHRLSGDAFERFARQELAKESSLRSRLEEVRPKAPSPKLPPAVDRQPPRWPGVVGAIGGLAVAGVAFSSAAYHRDAAGYAEALLSVATIPSDRDHLSGLVDDEKRQALVWTAAGWGGIGLAAVSGGYLAWREWRAPANASPATATSVGLLAAPLPGGAFASLSIGF